MADRRMADRTGPTKPVEHVSNVLEFVEHVSNVLEFNVHEFNVLEMLRNRHVGNVPHEGFGGSSEASDHGLDQICGRVAPRLGAELRSNSATGGDLQLVADSAVKSTTTERPRRVVLFLTGWVMPTDTSINVSLSQNSTFPKPRPPSLWTPDRDGTWKEVRPFLGFPGGKTKTIALDISDAFPAGDYRLRIATNMEFRWDEAFFTVDEEPTETIVRRLKVASADLHYRGFSALKFPPGRGPSTLDYARVSTEPQWPPMEGSFTRFGDVTELLTEQDDRSVILGAGDEITIQFGVPSEPVPAGWKRDFLLHNVGWDKDADLNTVYGQTVTPLPFHAMSGYPYGGDESYPDTPATRDYQRRFLTREQSWAGFWRWSREAAAARSRGKRER